MVKYYVTVYDKNGRELNVYRRTGKKNVLRLLDSLLDNPTWRFEVREV